jgi:hypothetical protein
MEASERQGSPPGGINAKPGAFQRAADIPPGAAT